MITIHANDRDRTIIFNAETALAMWLEDIFTINLTFKGTSYLLRYATGDDAIEAYENISRTIIDEKSRDGREWTSLEYNGV